MRINDVLVGTEADLQTWSSRVPVMEYINDRGGQSNAAQITGYDRSQIFVLTPEPAP